MAIFTLMSIFLIVLFDSFLMPKYVRMGTGRYMVNVIDKNISYGQKILDSEGYKIVVSDTLFTGVFEPGTIVDQYPKPNTRVKEGRTIRLKIAQPEKMVSIPDLIGRSLRSSELALNQIGLEIDTVYEEYNSDVPSGNVTWQYPKGGDLLGKGTGLHLTISLGVPPNFFQVPNLFGLSKKKAVGVEPCKNLANITTKKGYKTFSNYWNVALAKKYPIGVDTEEDYLAIKKIMKYK